MLALKGDMFIDPVDVAVERTRKKITNASPETLDGLKKELAGLEAKQCFAKERLKAYREDHQKLKENKKTIIWTVDFTQFQTGISNKIP